MRKVWIFFPRGYSLWITMGLSLATKDIGSPQSKLNYLTTKQKADSPKGHFSSAIWNVHSDLHVVFYCPIILLYCDAHCNSCSVQQNARLIAKSTSHLKDSGCSKSDFFQRHFTLIIRILSGLCKMWTCYVATWPD